MTSWHAPSRRGSGVERKELPVLVGSMTGLDP